VCSCHFLLTCGPNAHLFARLTNLSLRCK
jgi:hypothetical protein